MQTMYVGQLGSPVTELSQGINSSVTSIPTKNINVFPAPPNLASIGEGDQPEVILYTGKSGSSLTGITRGFGGSIAQSWDIDTVIARVFTTYDHNTFRTNILTLNTNKIETSAIGAASGVASLNSSVKIPVAQIPTAVANGVASLDNSAQVPANQLGNVVTTIPNQNGSGVSPIKIWVGTQGQYDSIGTKASDTLYFILE